MTELREKTIRQYMGILAAALSYIVVHEGAHLLAAVCFGVFRGIHVLGLGVQVDVYRELMTDDQLGYFCMAGPAATECAALVLTFFRKRNVRIKSLMLKAALYYITLAMLLVDPLYLSLLYGFFGGGDMNGIRLLIPEGAAREFFGLLCAVNALISWKLVFRDYQLSFQKQD